MQNMTKEDYAAVEDALERMGITELANRCVDELSGGQRQRVWIALALAQETDILLLDEPTTYLDIAYQVEILDLLTELNRRKGTTIVMILHDVNLSARYADHLFALCRGELIAEGKPADVITEELMQKVYQLIAIFKNKANIRWNGTSLSSQKVKQSEKHVGSHSEEHRAFVL